MDVALLDNGISCKDRLKNKIAKKKEFVSEDMAKTGNECFEPVHGSTCAEIISSISPDVQFLDLRIMYRDGTTQISILLEALDWCFQNNVKLIHMSLGTVDYFDIKPLEERIKKLIYQGAIIVAAYHNKNIKTYPAAFHGVFGVRQDYHGILANNQFLFQEQQGVNRENSIVAHWWEKCERNPANSYAAPVVTGYIANFLNKNPKAGFDEVLTFLEESSIRGKRYPDMLENVIRKEEPIEIPVIAGRGLHYEEMQKLTELFREKGYQALLLQENSTNGRAIPLAHYRGKDVSLTHILYTVNWIYMPDVIFLDFITNKMSYITKPSEIDVCIFYENQSYKVYAEKLIGTTKEVKRIRDIICQYYG